MLIENVSDFQRSCLLRQADCAAPRA